MIFSNHMSLWQNIMVYGKIFDIANSNEYENYNTGVHNNSLKNPPNKNLVKSLSKLTVKRFELFRLLVCLRRDTSGGGNLQVSSCEHQRGKYLWKGQMSPNARL